MDKGALQASAAYFDANARRLGLADPAAELYARSGRTDAQGVVHIRFNQSYQGVTVFEGEAITHVAPDGQVSITNALRGGLAIDVEPTVTADAAIATAVERTGAPASPPSSELVVLPRGERSAVDRLVWHVTVFSEAGRGPSQWDHFVDAHTGEIVWSFDSLETSAAIGTGLTMFVGDQPISTYFTGTAYTLTDQLRGASGGNYTCDQKNNRSGTCTVFTRPTNIFGNNGNNGNDSLDRATAGADAHYGLQATWDYYQGMWARNGIDNTGRRTYSRVHYGSNYQNAFWSNSCFCMTYGSGGPTFYPLVSVDIAGHEVSHGVMSTEANLTYSGESGGLNESSSDIFGTLIEFSVGSAIDVPDYWIGERAHKSNWPGGVYRQTKALRYMDDPLRDGMSPPCWSSTVGGLDVHYSSGPNNHMFWLLANGGTSRCNDQVVTGIGNDKAARIWYKAITDHMTSSTNYAGARAACLTAATALYGEGSVEYNAVAAAYDAIDVR